MPSHCKNRKSPKKWKAVVKPFGGSVLLGYFETREEAAAAEEKYWSTRTRRKNQYG